MVRKLEALPAAIVPVVPAGMSVPLQTYEYVGPGDGSDKGVGVADQLPVRPEREPVQEREGEETVMVAESESGVPRPVQLIE